jgi:hypothetical protein
MDVAAVRVRQHVLTKQQRLGHWQYSLAHPSFPPAFSQPPTIDPISWIAFVAKP